MAERDPVEMSASEEVSALLERLQRQRELYGRLKELSDQQSSLIERGETEALLQVLSQRQQYVDQLGRLHGELGPYKERWAALAPSMDQSRRDEVNALLGEVERLLGAIIEQDDRDREQLASARDRVGSQRQQVQAGGQALHAYQSAAQQAAKFTDREG